MSRCHAWVLAASCENQRKFFLAFLSAGCHSMTRPPTIPVGSWPLEMRAPTAAAYCDEPSVDAFLVKVQRGVYCAPSTAKGCLPKWHRSKLDRDIAHRHGLRFDDVPVVEDPTDLI